jgi:two-component system chemotaxis response regulator CheB
MVKVLIVDDSKVVQEFLVHILSSDPRIKIVGIASSGCEAINLVEIKRPDVITMDVHMSGIDGYEATRRIMESFPTPIVIVSGTVSTEDMVNTYKSLEVGALAFVHRPPGIEHPQYKIFSKELIQIVKLMSEVKVVKLFRRSRKKHLNHLQLGKAFEIDGRRIQLIAIGASMGGPMALQKILSALPKDLAVPVLIVQHIAAGFVKGFQEWLSLTSGIKLKVAKDDEIALAGTGYIAPDNFQMGISPGGKITLRNDPPENGSIPSVSYLFRSVSAGFGQNALGILLSGMGRDGADELKNMKENGALTIVQNEESSVMFGMPGEALMIGAADHALSPEGIAAIIAKSGLNTDNGKPGKIKTL